MKKVKITAIRKACYSDLMEQYENPISILVTQGGIYNQNGFFVKKFNFYCTLQLICNYSTCNCSAFHFSTFSPYGQFATGFT